MNKTLIIVDVQNDFITGSLPVEGGAEVAGKIAQLVTTDATQDPPVYAYVAATKDFHTDPGPHFADGEPDFVDTWPVHCVAGTEGAEFHDDILNVEDMIDQVFHKGAFEAAYSGFEGVDSEKANMTLSEWLKDRAVEEIDVVGIATSHCVKATAIDGVKDGLKVNVLLDYAVGVTPELTEAAIQEMEDAGVNIVEERTN